MNARPPFAEFRTRPIPDQRGARRCRASYRAHPIDAGDALFGENLAEAHKYDLAGENYYWSTRNPPYWRRIDGAVPSLLLRKSVAAKLARLDARLKSQGLELFLFDAWRPRAVQAYFHDHWMPAEILRRQPHLRGQALTAEVERYWAAPTQNPASPAPHATGAAVDLTIRWRGGDMLWMGSMFDDVTELAHRDRFERMAGDDFHFSDEEAQANRRLLHWLMAEEGFAGHPDEWWHFSWGDQLWAALTGARAAHYGLAEPGRNAPSQSAPGGLASK